jgi:hypothetical protein
MVFLSALGGETKFLQFLAQPAYYLFFSARPVKFR